MADELWNDLQYLALGRDDPEIFIPLSAYAEAVHRNRLSLIARPLNPDAQNLHTVITALPRSWGLTSRVHGRVLDATYVRFLFQSEVDLLPVQRREPWVFNNWLVAFQRWEDFPDIDFLTTIDLWVQIRGIPLPYVSNDTVRFIAGRLGEFVETDFDEATATQIVFIRVRVRFGITDRLRFFQGFRFRFGERAMINFQYERLRRLCSNCFQMTHSRDHCPFLPPNRMEPVIAERLDQVRGGVFDEVNRSDLNSQPQISERSFPEPISQPPPPRPITPLNPSEFAAAYPYFPSSDLENVQRIAVPIPQYTAGRRRQSSSQSSSSSNTNPKFEVGESSNYPRNDPDNETEGRNKRKFKENQFGGIQIPPKKR